jgi:hypothetical protein
MLNDSRVEELKVELIIRSLSFHGGSALGSSAIVFRLNQLPRGGKCFIEPNIGGLAVTTIFSIFCNDWYDLDGFITKFELFGNKILFRDCFLTLLYNILFFI